MTRDSVSKGHEELMTFLAGIRTHVLAPTRSHHALPCSPGATKPKGQSHPGLSLGLPSSFGHTWGVNPEFHQYTEGIFSL